MKTNIGLQQCIKDKRYSYILKIIINTYVYKIARYESTKAINKLESNIQKEVELEKQH